ncbi:MAG TPA: hypothetical protein VFX52_07845, partial [Nocardioidaceae bacterium]|nr:hypothetical protein [Nocardioidaceae bacterium]
VRQPFDGIVIWRDPHGQIYLVDHTGTHKVTTPGTTAGPATPHDIDIDIYPTDATLDLDPDDLGETAG